MKTITREEAVRLIEKARQTGRWCSAKVVKRTTGELRVLNFRGGVRKGVKGVGLKFNPSEHKLISIYDRVAEGHRFIAIEGIQELQIAGERYEVKE